MMNTTYTFVTDKFRPTPAELDKAHQDYINPGVFGRELADYVQAGLSAHGYWVKSRNPEDWGYWMEIEQNCAFSLGIGCANFDLEGDGLSEHRVTVYPNKPFVRSLQSWFRKIDVQPDVEKLVTVIGTALRSDEMIKDLQLTSLE